MTIEEITQKIDEIKINENDENDENKTDTEEDIEYESVYFKYCFDNCETIDEVISRLNNLKQQFEQYKKDGHKLTQPVDTGYCFIDKIVELGPNKDSI